MGYCPVMCHPGSVAHLEPCKISTDEITKMLVMKKISNLPAPARMIFYDEVWRMML